MKQLFLLIALSLYILSDSTLAIADNSDKYTTPYAGIPLKDAPLIINPPNGYIFFEGEKTRNILTEYFDNDPSDLTDIVGMLIPDTLSSIQYLGGSAWMFTYDKSGHVNDSHADKMDFNWLIEAYGTNSTPGERFSWAWKPEYNQDSHLLILPYLHTQDNTTELVLRMKMFGNDGVLQIERFASPSISDKIKEEASEIANGISYTKGNRYIDYGSDQYGSSYNSVSSYLKGIAVNYDDGIGSQEEEKDTTFLFLPIFIIKGIGIVAGMLLAAMLIFMAIVTVTSKKDENSHDISRLGFNVLMRICVFAMVYLLLLVLAVFLIWIGIELTVLVFSHVFSLYLVAIAFGIWALIGGFGYAILRSLFHFSKTERKDRMEIYERDAPKLFNIIRETSETVGEKMPKHVYVSPDANACVFYDKPVLSLFMPGRKNMQLGLALTEGLSIQELKSILAHEYGHFGQGSMRIGKIVATSYNIAFNIVNAEAFTSNAALTSLTRPLLNKVFGYVQRGYLQLSRAMEYEADEVSAKTTGSDIAISALCKSEVIMERLDGYNNLVAGIYKTDKLLPSTYWNGWQMYVGLCRKYDGVDIKAEEIVTGPLTMENNSLVKLKDIWTSHPTLRQRIENIKNIHNMTLSHPIESTFDLVSSDIYDKLSDLYFEMSELAADTPRDDSKYRQLLEKEMGERMFPTSLRAYFDRNIMAFDIQEVANIAPDNKIENPLTERNRAKMVEFNTMVSDYQTLMAFKEGATGEKEIQYDGKVYRRNNAPTEKLLGYLRATEGDIKTIDIAIARFALSKATDREDIIKAYDDIFFSYAIIRHIREYLIPARDQVAANLGSGGEVTDERFKQVQHMLISLRNEMRKFIASFDASCLEPVLFIDSATYLERLNDEWLCDGVSIGGDETAYVLHFPDFIISVFNSLIFFSKKKISDTLEGNPITLYWSGTVAAEKVISDK